MKACGVRRALGAAGEGLTSELGPKEGRVLLWEEEEKALVEEGRMDVKARRGDSRVGPVRSLG